jgi:hypothetical protein
MKENGPKISERERKSRESALPEVEISSFEASEVEGKLGTVRTRLKLRLEHAYFEMNRPCIAPRTRIARGEPSYASPNLARNKSVNWNRGVGELNSPSKTLQNALQIIQFYQDLSSQ